MGEICGDIGRLGEIGRYWSGGRGNGARERGGELRGRRGEDEPMRAAQPAEGEAQRRGGGAASVT